MVYSIPKNLYTSIDTTKNRYGWYTQDFAWQKSCQPRSLSTWPLRPVGSHQPATLTAVPQICPSDIPRKRSRSNEMHNLGWQMFPATRMTRMKNLPMNSGIFQESEHMASSTLTWINEMYKRDSSRTLFAWRI